MRAGGGSRVGADYYQPEYFLVGLGRWLVVRPRLVEALPDVDGDDGQVGQNGEDQAGFDGY